MAIELPPVVSVVIPTYNRAALLAEAVDSVLRQSFRDWELIIADDGSTDGTRAYLEQLTDARVRVLLLPHVGSEAKMRNAAVKEARGVWVAFLDSDDLWMPQKLEQQLGALQANPACEWSCTGFGFIDVSGQSIPQRSGLPYEARSGWILEQLLTLSAAATIPTVMVRRAVFDEIGGFDEQLLRTDYDLELRLAARSAICALPDVLTAVREHAGRFTRSERVITLLEENERVYRKALAWAPSAFIRAICRRQCAVQLLRVAQLQAASETPLQALGSLRRAAAVAPFSILVWRASVGIALRAGARAVSGARGT